MDNFVTCLNGVFSENASLHQNVVAEAVLMEAQLFVLG